jgi:hypothetical protein
MNAERAAGPSLRMPLASIAAMLSGRKLAVALAVATVSAGAAGCGGDSGPEPSIPSDDAQTMIGLLQEVADNVSVGSCIAASQRVDELKSEIDQLPASVNDDVRQALENGTDQLGILVNDPDQCETRTETTTTTETEPTTTAEEPTTTRSTPTQTQTQQTTTQQQTQTTPTSPSGGVGPGSPQGGL